MGTSEVGFVDEYATNDNEHFYLNETGQVEQTGCSRFILGKEYDSRTGEQCSLNSKNRVLPDQHCRFYPQLENNQATGSYMHMSFLSSVVEFCHSDVTGDPLSLHNAMAPSQQNIQCSYRSAWDVMLESEDFKNDHNPARQVTDTTPTFRVVKSASLRIVLVLDVSGSMNDNNRISILNQGTRKYIRATVPDGNSVGIVSFSSSATITSYLKELKTLQDREDLANLLPTTASGGTCIGCGLRSGIEVLENGGNNARGGIILLITDGQESSSYPRIIDMKPTLIGKGVGVDTVAFGTLADEKLQSLSDDTGGLSFLHGEGESSTGLNDALTATITSRIWGSSNVPFELHSEKREIPAAGNLIGSIIIDSTIGRHTKFFFLWSTSLISVVLRRPEGTAIDASAPEYKSDDGAKTVSIEISGIAEPGIWLYELSGSQQQVETLVKSVARYNTQPIVVSTTTSKSLVTELPAMTNIYVQVKMGYSPVFKANVTATVERPSTYQAVDVRLLDNGAVGHVSSKEIIDASELPYCL
ncbi:calcium-activated chloride channel regulator 3A-1-like [Ptychodera flava]|uniref:calcium-activated chloride channel regulator 3A-1-like n=1 Tax=Ptychodera flava TaxID=63121 RepID=UPI00396A88B5